MSEQHFAGPHGQPVNATVVHVPRWLEVHDRTPGDDQFDLRRRRYYVVSPYLSTPDAELLAREIAHHQHLQVAAKRHDGLVGLAMVLAIVTDMLLVGLQAPLWSLAVPILALLVYWEYARELAQAARLPLDVEEVMAQASDRVMFRIHPREYDLAMRAARHGEEQAAAVHKAMWRAFMLRDFAERGRDTLDEFAAAMGDAEPRVLESRAKVDALWQRAQEAHQRFLETVDPRRRPQGSVQDQLTELTAQIDAILAAEADPPHLEM